MIRFLSFIFLLLASTTAFAKAPELKTQAPVIYLADNLDEADQLGWCIDTRGRGFGEFLHAHSCKPQGGDVQFGFETKTGLIRSVAFPDFCMIHDPKKPSPMGLVLCDAKNDGQVFNHNKTGEITLGTKPSLCLSVGEESGSAGPFMSRSLDMKPCPDVSEPFKVWRVLP